MSPSFNAAEADTLGISKCVVLGNMSVTSESTVRSAGVQFAHRRAILQTWFSEIRSAILAAFVALRLRLEMRGFAEYSLLIPATSAGVNLQSEAYGSTSGFCR